jgi:hypothetical protein
MTLSQLTKFWIVLVITLGADCLENTSSINYIVSRSFCTDCLENIASQLVHWGVLGTCCIATGLHATILKFIIENYDVMTWTGLIWLGIGISDAGLFLLTRK